VCEIAFAASRASTRQGVRVSEAQGGQHTTPSRAASLDLLHGRIAGLGTSQASARISLYIYIKNQENLSLCVRAREALLALPPTPYPSDT
jgi:hypothetical protein